MVEIDSFDGFEFDSEARIWHRIGRAEFGYSDGDEHENYVYEAIRSSSDISTSSIELADKIKDWPSMYHLSRRRANLLRPFAEWFKGKRILEIGSGCGAITRFLGECGATVVGLEGSRRRAGIARERTRDLSNVTLLCGTSEDAGGLGEFDAVMLIGVLEYSRKYLGPSGMEALLGACRARCKTDGMLFVAIENQLGLKYLAGEAEDHVSLPMFGVEDLYRPDGVATFGREELTRLLGNNGFATTEWWHPFPDYKMPVTLLSEDAVCNRFAEDLSPLITETLALDPQRTYRQVFSPERAWGPIYRNGLGSALSNSFLVIGSAQPIAVAPGSSVAFHYSAERKPEYSKAVRVDVDGQGQLQVSRSRLYPLAAASEPSLTMTLEEQAEAFHDGSLWQQELGRVVAVEGWGVAAFRRWFDTWLSAITKAAALPPLSDASVSLSQPIPSCFIDATPRNLLVRPTGELAFIDLEWELDSQLELGYLIFRAVYVSLGAMGAVAPPEEGTPLQFSSLLEEALRPHGAKLDEASLQAYIAAELSFAKKTHGGAVGKRVMQNASLHVRPPFSDELVHLRDQVASRLADIEFLKALALEKDKQIEVQGFELSCAKSVLEELHSCVEGQLASPPGQSASEATKLAQSRDQAAGYRADVEFMKALAREKDGQIEVRSFDLARARDELETLRASTGELEAEAKELALLKASVAYRLHVLIENEPASIRNLARGARLVVSLAARAWRKRRH